MKRITSCTRFMWERRGVNLVVRTEGRQNREDLGMWLTVEEVLLKDRTNEGWTFKYGREKEKIKEKKERKNK